MELDSGKISVCIKSVSELLRRNGRHNLNGNKNTQLMLKLRNCRYGSPLWTVKKVHRQSEKPASLGIIGAQLKVSLKPLNTIVL